jgi:hypothetical protein
MKIDPDVVNQRALENVCVTGELAWASIEVGLWVEKSSANLFGIEDDPGNSRSCHGRVNRASSTNALIACTEILETAMRLTRIFGVAVSMVPGAGH